MNVVIKSYETCPIMERCIIRDFDELRPPIIITVPDWTAEYYYVHLDNMGSIQLISDSNANLVNEWQYSAWGARTRIYGDSDLTNRGYTLHEYILSPFGGAGGGFGLINMNGRIYDPVLARFLSPDPYVQMPDFTQSYNRYSYCLNNPFSYTDPSGEFIHLIVGAIIGGFANLISNADNIEHAWQAFAYFGLGAVVGALSAGIGTGISAGIAAVSSTTGATFASGFAAGFVNTAANLAMATGFVAGAVSGAVGGAVGGFLTGFGNALIQNQSIGDALVAATKSALIGAGIGFAVGGIIGGIDAVRHDLNFWTGADKQHGVIKINSRGETCFTDKSKFVKNTTTDPNLHGDIKVPKEYWTEFEGNANVKLTSDGEWYLSDVKMPQGTRVTNIEYVKGKGEMILKGSYNSNKRGFSLVTSDKARYVIIHGYRWEHYPITQSRDLLSFWRVLRIK